MDRISLFSELGEIPSELCKLLEGNVLLWLPRTQGRAVSSRGRPAMKLDWLRRGWYRASFIRFKCLAMLRCWSPPSHLENSIYLGRGIIGLFWLPSITPRRCLWNDFHVFSFLILLMDIDAEGNLCLWNNGNFLSIGSLFGKGHYNFMY